MNLLLTFLGLLGFSAIMGAISGYVLWEFIRRTDCSKENETDTEEN